MANVLYNSAKVDIATGQIDLDTDSFKVMLVTSSYTPDPDAHNRRDDITNEVVGTGYTTGGTALVSPAVTQDNTNDLMKFDATDTSWSTSTITARGAVIYKSRGGASSADELLCYIDFSTDKSSTAGTFTIQWNASGILTLT
jgi:hypothetical protein